MKTIKSLFFSIGAVLVSGAAALAGNVWDGGGTSGSWSDLANWDSNTTPVSPTGLTFGGSSQLSSTNDLFATGTVFNGLTFNATAGAFTISGNGITLGGNIANNSTSTQTINLNMALSANRSVVMTAGGGNVNLGGDISGVGFGLTFSGNGTATLSGNNTYSADTVVGTSASQSIVLVIGNKNALGGGTLRFGTTGFVQASTDLSGANKINNSIVASLSTTFNGTNSIEIGGSYTLNNTGSRNLTNNIAGGTLTLTDVVLNLDTTTRTLTIDGTGTTIVKGVISNGGASNILGIGGNGTVNLQNENTYTGGTNITANGGTVILGNKQALGTGNVTMSSVPTLQASTDLTGANRLSNNFTYTGATGVTVSGNYSLEIGGKFAVNQNGSRSLTNNLASGKLLILNDVDINTNVGTTLTLAGTGDTTINGVIANGAATARNLTITNTGITTLAGSNTYNGTTAVNGGMVVFAKTAAKGVGAVTANAAGSIGLGVGGTGYYSSANVDSLFANTLSGFTMNAASGVGIDTSAGNFTYSTNQSAARSLTKLGANVLTLSGTNTYSGATIVHAGTLLVNGSIGGSGVTVRSGGALGGSGTVGTSVVVQSGGTLTPGNSPGLLTQGATTLQGGGNYNWQLLDATGAAGTGFDSINLTSGSVLAISATSGNKFNINLWTLSSTGPDVNGNALNFNSGSSYSWTLFATNQLITGFDVSAFAINTSAINGTAGFANTFTGTFTLALTDGGTDLSLVYTAVPEPTSWALLALSLTFALVMRRRGAR